MSLKNWGCKIYRLSHYPAGVCDSTSPPLTSAQQVSVLVKSGFSGLTWKLLTLPESPEPALGAVTHSSGQGVLPWGPFLLPQTYVMLSDGVLCKKCIFQIFFFPQMICYIVMGLPVHLIISYYYASTVQAPFEYCFIATLRLAICSSWVLVGWSHGSSVTPAFQLQWLSPFSWSITKPENICAWLRSRLQKLPNSPLLAEVSKIHACGAAGCRRDSGHGRKNSTSRAGWEVGICSGLPGGWAGGRLVDFGLAIC